MKETCQNFKIIPVADVLYVYRNSITLLPGKDYDELCAGEFAITVNSETADAGTVWTVDQNINIEKVSPELAIRYSIHCAVILIIEYTDGSHTIFGSPEYPVMVLLTQDVQKDTLSVTLKTPDRPLI